MKKGYMKKIMLFLYCFLVTGFIGIIGVHADYQATVINPSGAKCSLKSGSTGYCYYSDSNLNDYVREVVWLDTGDVVTVLDGHSTVSTNDPSVCSDYYVYTSFYFASKAKTYSGYYCHANLSNGDVSDALKQEFSQAGFPESYWNRLAILKQAHPNWTFKAINTGLDFSDAVNGEIAKANWSLVQKSASNNYAYLATDSASFNYYGDYFIAYDDVNGSNPWYNANYSTVSYYMDPRNFLSDMHIFQFEGLSYDSSISDDALKSSISGIFTNDYLSKFTDDFLTAGKISKVSPVYLASLSKQEVGNGANPGTAINGQYNGMYNFYNIGATGGANPVLNGLIYASANDATTMRPWDTTYKAIVGGAIWQNDKYISAGQDTSYFKKWNVIYNYLISTGKVASPFTNYNHQYMTNIMAPSSEANITYKSYINSGILNSKFVFYIPVYNNMPATTSLPNNGGWPNNYLSSISINGNNITGFDGGNENYNYYLDGNSITLGAKAVSSSASISGLGTFNITSNTTLTIKVTAQNGNVKNYNINVILTGNKIDAPTDIVSTLNNAGIKNGNNYLSGISVGSDIKTIKEKIMQANGNAQVTLKGSNGEIKNSGVISTGDKVSVTVNGHTKEYEVVIYGDISGDGVIDSLDFIRIKKYMLAQITLSDSNYEAADISKDGLVDTLDFIRIKKYMLGNYGSILQ